MPKNAKKCQKMSEYVEKCQKMPKPVKIIVPKNAEKCQKMPKNAEKRLNVTMAQNMEKGAKARENSREKNA